MKTNQTLNEAFSWKIPKIQDFFTIDPYTKPVEYNQALMALENNKIEYSEWISLIGNYNWYLTLENGQKPIMINYDQLSPTDWKFVVSKVKPLAPSDEYMLYRRGEKKDIARYVENDVFRMARNKNSVVFSIRNKEELFQLSKVYGIIFPLGVYYNSTKLAICFNPEIKSAIEPSRVLLEKGKHSVGALELDINWKILRNRDKIVKFVRTPYWKDGKFYQTSPASPLRIL